jgi:alkylation response protein AidB-like acyl-CoA dehydrogenase
VATEAEVSEQVTTWFHEAWDPDLSLIEWRGRLVDSGWAVPSWSAKWFGRDLPAWADGVAHRTVRDLGGVVTPLGSGMGLAAPTMYDHGSDELLAEFLRPTLTGELTWCQLFSEPVAGSDLAGLKTTAVRDGDQWVVNGQKVWNTSAHHADMGILVTRTDWDAVKHAGLTYFVIDMHQDAIEVRSIKQMNYHASFNEVFLTDAVVPHSNMVGDEGEGWKVTRGTLAHERKFGSRSIRQFKRELTGRVIDEARVETAEHEKTYVWYPQRTGRFDLLQPRAQAAGKATDPLVRQKIAATVSLQRAATFTAERARMARELGRPPGSEGSIGKLTTSMIARACNDAHSTICGPDGMLTETADPVHATVAEVLISTPAQSIAGGTDEIQHNILGENMLGLPKEPAADRGMPFREVGRT